MIENNCPLLDVRNTRSFKELKDTNVVLGDLNLLGWVILKSDMKFNKMLNEPLAKRCAVNDNKYWERLVTVDDQHKILFPSNFKGNRFQKNHEIPFHLLESKFNFDYSVAMYYLKNNFEFSLFDFKLYRPNLITNDGYINHYQKVHRDFKVTFPKIVVTIGGPTSSNKSSRLINSCNSKISSSTPKGSSSDTKNKPTSSDKTFPSSTAIAKFLEKGETNFVRVDGILRLKSELKKKQIVVMKI